MNSSKFSKQDTPGRASQSLSEPFDNGDILLIHLGGLGDVCLSESLFFSFQKHFGNRLVGLGNKRFLDLFGEYFVRAEGVESRRWLYLFSEKLDGPVWSRIVFIGKDREGILRKRWQAFSEKELIFIDMYPENAFEHIGSTTLPQQGFRGGAFNPCRGQGKTVRNTLAVPASLITGSPARAPGVEIYQLAQLKAYGIAPLNKKILPKRSARVIIYPEKGFTKNKLHHDDFLRLYRSLGEKGLEAVVLESLGLAIDAERKVSFEDLIETKRFFSGGGVFVSNDSGMAHLAGVSGLFTVTIFTDFNPAAWHPRGRNVSLILGRDVSDLSGLETIILRAANDRGRLPQ